MTSTTTTGARTEDAGAPSRDDGRVPAQNFGRTTFFILACTSVLSGVLLFATVDPHLREVGMLAGGLDTHIYRDGALRVLRDIPLYEDPTLAGLSYTYTPFSTLSFLPIAAVPWGWVNGTWAALNLVMLFGCVLLCWKLLGYTLTRRLAAVSALITLTCTFLEPVRSTLYYGQINLILMALVLLGFSRPDGSRARGIGVGIAAGIKLVPLFFVVQFAVLRQWRAALTAAATFLATVLIAWIVLPADSRQYWTSTFFHSDRIAPDTQPANQSLRGAVAHLLDHPVQMRYWLLLAVPVAVVGLLVSAALYQRGERLLGVTLSGMTACAVSPFAWNHHWVWFVPLFVYCVHRAQSAPRWWGAAGALYLAAGAWSYHWTETWVVVGWFLFPPSWPVSPILLNMYVIVYLIILGAALRFVGVRRGWALVRGGAGA